MLFHAENYNTLNKETKNKIILLPLGAIEQHGPHLSVSTDTDMVTKVASTTEKQLPDDILLCPTLPFGSSHHHLHFGGTISISAEMYTKLVVEIIDSLLQIGFRRIVILNGHGGNVTPVKQALSLISNKFDKSLNPNIVLITYWDIAGKTFAGAPPMETPALSHACEYETSMLLHLFPEKVFPDKIQRAKRPASNGYIPFEDDEPFSGVIMAKQTPFISSNGCSGEPQLATAEKGKHLFENAVAGLVKFIQSFKNWPFLNNLTE